MSLSAAKAETRLPVCDLERAKQWYADHLDLHPNHEREGHLVYRLAAGTSFCLFASTGAADGTFTQLALEVGEIGAEVAALRRRGVVFQTYPTFAMTDGIADIGGEPGRGPADRAAWFHDADHNLISLYQFQSTFN
jgi:catechol 2,3-dioxygenase-like lactoylglutathione lyase family enzyme